MLVKLRLGTQRMAGRVRPGVASPVCARWESAAWGHPPLLSVPWAPRVGVSCPSLNSRALQLWTLNLQIESTCTDERLGAH